MSDWIWLVRSGAGRTEIVLADRDALGSICEPLGHIGMELSAKSWPWYVGLSRTRFNLGAGFWCLANVLLNLAERHTLTLARIPADDDLTAALVRAGVLDEDDG